MFSYIRIYVSVILGAISFFSPSLIAAEYEIDAKHSFIVFRIKHLGYTWLYGEFREFKGRFSFDRKKPEESTVSIVVSTDSIDTNHSVRDTHLRSADFLDTKEYPEATFQSTSYSGDENSGIMTGNLLLHGVNKELRVSVNLIGEGEDPWGGYRAGFLGKMTLLRSDFGMGFDLGPEGQIVEFQISIEGVRK